jgi:hypothetical protein
MTQLQANHKAIKDAKAKAAKDKKLATAACRAETMAKNQEKQAKLISSAKAKASKVVAKAKNNASSLRKL